MISVDTRLNALIRAMTEEQKRRLTEAAKVILMDDQKNNLYKGDGNHAETQHPRNEDQPHLCLPG